jgi:tetratricopeptide (TPR) repeat protein
MLENMLEKKSIARFAVRLAAGCAIAFAAVANMDGCQSSGGSALTREQYRAAATALFQQQLYREAVDMYDAYLKSPAIPPEDVSKVLYQMGTIYQDNLLDPKAALAKYAVVKALYPDETFNNQIGKRMVACLETMGRSVDATQARSRITDLVQDTSAKSAGSGAVVADLDGRKITLGEIASMVGKLPDAPLEQNQLVREYVAQILIADAARRKGVADKPEVKLRLGQVQNQILAQAGLMDEIKIQPPSGNDLKYYFEANKARYLKGTDSAATFETLAPKVQADWAREKQGAEYQRYVERLLQTSKVTFFNSATGAAAKP